MDEAAQHRIAELEAALAASKLVHDDDRARISELEQQVAKLLEQMSRNSGNSNKPPSSDAPGTRAQRRAKDKKSKRNRGGQPGHPGSKRALLPPEYVDKFVHLFPPECENCWRPLPETPDPKAQRYQTTELPPVRPHTTEYQQHSVLCPCCSHRTWAPYDKIPISPFGPQLSSVIALLTGVYHLSRRATVTLLSDVLGVEISLGAVSAVEARMSDAVKPAVDEAWKQVEHPLMVLYA